MTLPADVVLACGMCVVTAYGVLVGVAGWVKYLNARQRAAGTTRETVEPDPPAEHPSPSPQPA